MYWPGTGWPAAGAANASLRGCVGLGASWHATRTSAATTSTADDRMAASTEKKSGAGMRKTRSHPAEAAPSSATVGECGLRCHLWRARTTGLCMGGVGGVASGQHVPRGGVSRVTGIRCAHRVLIARERDRSERQVLRERSQDQEGPVSAVTSRYDDHKNDPGMALVADRPAGSCGAASMKFTAGGSAAATDLYKLLPGHDELYVRWYAKYQD